MSDPPAPALGAQEQPLTVEERQAVRTWLRRDPRWTEHSLLVLVSRYDATVAAQAARLRETDQRDSDRLFQVVRLESDLRLAQDTLDAQAARLAERQATGDKLAKALEEGTEIVRALHAERDALAARLATVEAELNSCRGGRLDICAATGRGWDAAAGAAGPEGGRDDR